jgi:hypothetical protein
MCRCVDTHSPPCTVSLDALVRARAERRPVDMGVHQSRPAEGSYHRAVHTAQEFFHACQELTSYLCKGPLVLLPRFRLVFLMSPALFCGKSYRESPIGGPDRLEGVPTIGCASPVQNPCSFVEWWMKEMKKQSPCSCTHWQCVRIEPFGRGLLNPYKDPLEQGVINSRGTWGYWRFSKKPLSLRSATRT